jgi:hypothetical protein
MQHFPLFQHVCIRLPNIYHTFATCKMKYREKNYIIFSRIYNSSKDEYPNWCTICINL